MRPRKILHCALAACVVGAAVALAAPAHALRLITKSEAALPPARGGHERGISRGPGVVVVFPSPEAGTVRSPLELKIKFVAHGGAKIDTDSVLVTYLKEPAVDLTQRLKQFIEPTGIDVKNAEVPPGTHWLRVDVADTEGHQGWAEFTFTVSR